MPKKRKQNTRNTRNEPKPDNFQAFLDHVFLGSYSSNDFEANNNTELIQLYGYLFRHCGKSLERFTDKQVNDGLNCLLSSNDNYAFTLRDGGGDEALKIQMIRDMIGLYEQCFSKRCAPILAHLNQHGTPVNNICYMLWDTTPLNYFPKEERLEKVDYCHAILQLLEEVLAIDHVACVESALHGLGHMYCDYPEFISRSIDTFLRKNPNIDSDLRHYAICAQKGMVQ